MKVWTLLAFLALLVVAGVGEAGAQASEEREVLIQLFRVAPGQHETFLRRQAEREAIAREAGAPPPRWYVHHNGDSWDFLTITDVPADQAAVDRRIDELTRERGLTTGLAAALEFRQSVAWHTDTFAGGPFTADELVQAIGEP